MIVLKIKRIKFYIYLNIYYSAYVELIFLTPEQEELRFRRSIQSTGGSDYSYNGRNVTLANYNKALEDISILVSVRNFLVFQGDIESLSRKSPKELTAMVFL